MITRIMSSFSLKAGLPEDTVDHPSQSRACRRIISSTNLHAKKGRRASNQARPGAMSMPKCALVIATIVLVGWLVQIRKHPGYPIHQIYAFASRRVCVTNPAIAYQLPL